MWCLRSECVKFCNADGSLLLRYSTVQNEGRWNLCGQGQADGLKVLCALCALCQHKHLASLHESRNDFGGDGLSSVQIPGKDSE